MKKFLLSIMLLVGATAVMAGPMPDGTYTAASFTELKACISSRLSNGTSDAKIKLTADIYLKDEGELCRTFTGILDGNGHTIYAGDASAHHDGRGLAHGKYLFTYSEGATFKNLTFKDFRADTEEHSNWSILTSQATNCKFSYITFDHVSIWCNHDNVGAVAGIATNCTFENIKVMNSDFTVDGCAVGAIVGRSQGSFYKECTVDDHTTICADGSLSSAYAGGLVGFAKEEDEFQNCINSAFVAGDGGCIGGIAGNSKNCKFTGCLNTGMIISLVQSKVPEFSKKYGDKTFACETKYAGGKRYDVRVLDKSHIDQISRDSNVGGIVGTMDRGEVDRCVNFGSIYTVGDLGGIVGHTVWGVTIKNSVGDFKCNSNGDVKYGIAEGNEKNIYINCVSALPDHEIFTWHWGYAANSYNNYTRKPGYNESWGRSVSELEMTSGQLATELGLTHWEQNLGTDRTPLPALFDKLYHTREITEESEGYGLACLPYTLWSNSVTYYTFQGVKEEGDTIKLLFLREDFPAPGTPVLYRAAPGTVNMSCYNMKSFCWTPETVTPEGSSWSLEGTYGEKTFSEYDSRTIYQLSGDRVTNDTKTVVSPFNAYFRGPNIIDLNNNGKIVTVVAMDTQEEVDFEMRAMPLRKVLRDATAVGFEESDFNSDSDFNFNSNFNGKTYSVTGAPVNENYRGIVIKNGKRYLKK